MTTGLKRPNLASELTRITAHRNTLVYALCNLLDCCELNLDELEENTINCIREARAAIDEAYRS